MTIQQDKFVPDMVNATNVMKKVWLQSVLAIMEGKARIVLVQLKKSLARTKKPDKYAWEMDNANVTMVNDASVMKGTVENTANVNRVITTTANQFCHVSSRRLTKTLAMIFRTTRLNATKIPNPTDKLSPFLVPTSR